MATKIPSVTMGSASGLSRFRKSPSPQPSMPAASAAAPCHSPRYSPYHFASTTSPRSVTQLLPASHLGASPSSALHRRRRRRHLDRRRRDCCLTPLSISNLLHQPVMPPSEASSYPPSPVSPSEEVEPKLEHETNLKPESPRQLSLPVIQNISASQLQTNNVTPRCELCKQRKVSFMTPLRTSCSSSKPKTC